MYKNIHKFVPFQHDNLEFKNNLINFARGLSKSTPEGAFSTALVYANVVDYVARHLLNNLFQMVSIQSFTRFGGTFFFDGSKRRTSMPLGDLARELTHFEFPNKSDFLDALNKFNVHRKDVLHNLMQLDPNGNANKFEKSIEKMGNIAEDILAKYNVIVSGLTTAWNSPVSNPQTPTQKNAEEVEPKKA